MANFRWRNDGAAKPTELPRMTRSFNVDNDYECETGGGATR